MRLFLSLAFASIAYFYLTVEHSKNVIIGVIIGPAISRADLVKLFAIL